METKEKKKVTKVFIDLNAVHPLDKIDLHRQNGEMLNRDVMIVNLGIKKLEVVNEKLSKQLKNEKLEINQENKSGGIRKMGNGLGSQSRRMASVKALVKTKET
jgi:hypothetical protein